MPTPNISTYPKLLPLRDGEVVAIRPMVSGDEATLLDFFLRLLEEERFYLKDDVTAPGVIAGWVRDLDYERVLPLLAWQHDHIVGARRYTADGVGRVAILARCALRWIPLCAGAGWAPRCYMSLSIMRLRWS